MARVILDTATYVDMHRAPKRPNVVWALNTIHHAAAHLASFGKPVLSTLGIMEIEAGFEEDLRAAKRQAFREAILPMFETIPYGVEEASLGGEIYAKLEAKGSASAWSTPQLPPLPSSISLPWQLPTLDTLAAYAISVTR